MEEVNSENNVLSHAKQVLGALAEKMAYIGGFVVFILMILVSADVIGRKVWTSVPGSFELSEALMVPAVFFPLMFVQMRREHVFVGVTTDWLSARTVACLDGLAAVIGFLMFGLLTWLSFGRALDAYSIGEYRLAVISVPIWPFRLMIPLGTGLMVLQLAIMAIEEFSRAFGRDEPSRRQAVDPI